MGKGSFENYETRTINVPGSVIFSTSWEAEVSAVSWNSLLLESFYKKQPWWKSNRIEIIGKEKQIVLQLILQIIPFYLTNRWINSLKQHNPHTNHLDDVRVRLFHEKFSAYDFRFLTGRVGSLISYFHPWDSQYAIADSRVPNSNSVFDNGSPDSECEWLMVSYR